MLFSIGSIPSSQEFEFFQTMSKKKSRRTMKQWTLEFHKNCIEKSLSRFRKSRSKKNPVKIHRVKTSSGELDRSTHVCDAVVNRPTELFRLYTRSKMRAGKTVFLRLCVLLPPAYWKRIRACDVCVMRFFLPREYGYYKNKRGGNVTLVDLANPRDSAWIRNIISRTCSCHFACFSMRNL